MNKRGEPYKQRAPTKSIYSETRITRIHGEILVGPKRWIEMAFQEAKNSVEAGGSLVGAVFLQIADETG